LGDFGPLQPSGGGGAAVPEVAPSRHHVIPALQHCEVGQAVPLVPGEASGRTAFTVRSFQPNRVHGALVPAETKWLLWSKPDSTGAGLSFPRAEGGTRLVTRIRARYDWQQPLARVTAMLLMEFGDFAMLRRMLRGIRTRAESGHILTGRPAPGAVASANEDVPLALRVKTLDLPNGPW
jgi:hypothetical protein